jgi:hypothetical protein
MQFAFWPNSLSDKESRSRENLFEFTGMHSLVRSRQCWSSCPSQLNLSSTTWSRTKRDCMYHISRALLWLSVLLWLHCVPWRNLWYRVSKMYTEPGESNVDSPNHFNFAILELFHCLPWMTNKGFCLSLWQACLSQIDLFQMSRHQ